MVAGLFAMLVSWCWRRSESLSLTLPAHRPRGRGLSAAFAYCIISGFAVPAQRTLYMVGVVALALWLGRAASASRVLAAALLLVLLPTPGGSVSGVLAIVRRGRRDFFRGHRRTAKSHWLAQWGRVHGRGKRSIVVEVSSGQWVVDLKA